MRTIRIALWAPIRVLVLLVLSALIPLIDKSLDKHYVRASETLLGASNKLLRFQARGASWAYGTEIVEEE